MKKLVAMALALCLALSSLPAALAAQMQLADVSVVDTTVDYQANPVGISAKDVKFSWAMESDAIGASQLNYQIVVHKDSPDGEIVWDSGEVEDARSTAVAYAGEALEAEGRYYWDVTVTDQNGTEATSKTAWFEIAPELEDATWLMAGNKDEAAPMFRTEVQLEKDVAKASLSLTAMGIYEAYINGQEVQSTMDDIFNPGMANYNTNVSYQTYDVTKLLSKGANAIGVVVGGGWYQTAYNCNFRNTFGPDDSANERGLLGKLVVTYTDGTKAVFTTNPETWKVSQDGPITYDDQWNGESYDARIANAVKGWNEAGYDVSNWAVPATTTYGGKVLADGRATAYINPDYEQAPISGYTYVESETSEAGWEDEEHSFWFYGAVQEHPVDVNGDITVKPGEVLVLDMGQNMAGFNNITVTGPEGATVTMRHAEYLNDGRDPDYNPETGRNGSYGSDGPKGTLFFSSLRSAKSTDQFTLAGTGKEVYQPHFTFHGYRYVQIEADQEVTLHDLRGIVISSVGEETGLLETSDKDINQLISNTKWSQMANYLSIPTDCPQRNERAGWTGDAQLFAQTAVMNFDVNSFLERYIDVMNDYMATFGTYADVMPKSSGARLPNCGWSDAGVIIPWVMYKQTGDAAIIENAYPYMAQYTKQVAQTGYATWAYGDWLAPWPASLPFTSAAYELYINEIMADMAELIGNAADVKTFENRAETVRQQMIDKYIDEDGNLLTATADLKPDGSLPTVGFFPAMTCMDNAQTGLLWALKLGVYDSEETRQALIKNLLINIRNENQSIRPDGAENSLSVGFLGVNVLLPVLTDVGEAETAYTLLLQDQNPSWLYSVKQGATTIWERWDAYSKENSFGTSSMNSFNHYSYGACLEWMYNYMSGIKEDEANPGYKHFILQPTVDSMNRITFVNGSYDSLYGQIVSNWTSDDGEIATYTATVPANTTATLYLPVSGKRVNVPAELAGLVEVIGEVTHNGETAIQMELPAGSYAFTFTDDAVEMRVNDGALVVSGIELALTGADEVTVDVETLSYTLSVKDAIRLATATVSFDVDGLENPVVEGMNGWYIISQSVENGVVTALLANNDGVTGDAEIAKLTGATTGRVGQATVTLTEAVLSAYVGESEAFIYAIVKDGTVTTNVRYSLYDVNRDGKVDQLDITRAQRAYGAVPGDDNWNALADVDGNSVIEITDFILILNNYTK